jgi:hypothetical protein
MTPVAQKRRGNRKNPERTVAGNPVAEIKKRLSDEEHTGK